jgi:hypothetical protein
LLQVVLKAAIVRPNIGLGPAENAFRFAFLVGFLMLGRHHDNTRQRTEGQGTVSSFVEWAVEESIRRVTVGRQWVADENVPGEGTFEPVFLAHVATRLWDVDEADRFAKLAIN